MLTTGASARNKPPKLLSEYGDVAQPIATRESVSGTSPKSTRQSSVRTAAASLQASSASPVSPSVNRKDSVKAMGMANSSNIPNHPVSELTDFEGYKWPTNCNFFITNACSGHKQCLTYIRSSQKCETRPKVNIDDSKWVVEFANNDRRQVAFRNIHTNGYLAAASTDHGSVFVTHDAKNWFWIYKGGEPNTFWLSTSQAQDSFLHTWDNVPDNSARPLLFNVRDPKAGNMYNMPWDKFEAGTAGLSWRLDLTPEATLAKMEREKDSGQAREEALNQREQKAQQAQVDAQQRQNDVEAREKALAAREQEAQEQEQKAKTRTADLEKREAAVKAGEERIQNSKNPNQKQALESQQEADKHKSEKEDVQEELEKLRDVHKDCEARIADLSRQLEEAKRNSGGGRGGGGVPPPRVLPPQRLPPQTGPPNTLPPQNLPPQTGPPNILPPRRIPPNTRPAASLGKGYNKDLMKRFEAGRQAIVSTRH